jgi:hypothetical protein
MVFWKDVYTSAPIEGYGGDMACAMSPYHSGDVLFGLRRRCGVKLWLIDKQQVERL